MIFIDFAREWKYPSQDNDRDTYYIYIPTIYEGSYGNLLQYKHTNLPATHTHTQAQAQIPALESCQIVETWKPNYLYTHTCAQ